MYATRSLKRALLFILAIPLLYLTIWRIIPAFHAIYLSFTKYNMVWDDGPSFIAFDNYITIFGDQNFISSLKLTFLFAALATAIQFFSAMFLALIFDSAIRGKNFIMGVIIAPMVLTPAVVGIMWYILYNDRIGPINYFLEALGFQAVGWISETQYALPAIILADVWQWTPFLFLLFIAALQTIPPGLYEAAAIDGAGWRDVVRYIKLPLLLRISAVAVLLRFMDAFREFDKVFVMTGGGPGRATELATVFVYKSAFRHFEIGYASALLVTILVIISLIYGIFVRLLKV